MLVAAAALLGADGLAARAAGSDDRGACAHAEECDCPAPVGFNELRLLISRLDGPKGAAARAELLARCGRVVERASASFGDYAPTERVRLLGHAHVLKGIARPLARLGFRDRDPEVRAAAIRLARALRDREVLTALAGSEVATERLIAAESLDAAEGGAPPLVALLGDRDPAVRRAAARGLAQASRPDCVAALLRAARDDHDPVVRARAAASLAALAPVPIDDAVRAEAEAMLSGGLPPAELLPLLPDLLRGLRIEAYAILAAHPQPVMRAAGYVALGASLPTAPFERARAVELLLGGLGDPDLAVARAAARAIGRGGVREAAPALVDRLRSRDDPLAPDAALALERLAGERRPPTYAAWKAWLDESGAGSD